MRGGTSKGAYFLADDLPSDTEERNDLLLRVMGSPDARQIDGVGGAHPLTSKVGVISRSTTPGVDVDYLFLQVFVDEALVSDKQNCGNVLAGVGPFAVERGLVTPTGDVTPVSIRMVNTNGMATASVHTPGGQVNYAGDVEIAGVPGTAAPIVINFESAEATGSALLPTGAKVDVIDGLEVTCVDNGMPVVVMRAADLNITGQETCAELETDAALRNRLESIRLQAGELMGLGDVTSLTVPKLTMVSLAVNGGSISTRTFIPHRCHTSIGVLGAASVVVACALPSTPANSLVSSGQRGARYRVEHPTGHLDVEVELETGSDRPRVSRTGVVRTARKLFDGTVFPRPRP
jgi:4-oxalomesaconate tautomerase